MTETLPTESSYETLPMGGRLSMRALQEDEASAVIALVDENRGYLAEFLPWVEETTSVADSENFIRLMNEMRRQKLEYGFGIYDDGELIGHASLMKLGSATSEIPAIGYWIAKKASGKGVATAVTRALTEFGLNVLGLDKITIRADTENIGSNTVAEKCGYTLVETEQNDTKDTSLVNHWVIEKKSEIA